jgi:AraC-like DNA-binding protein
MRATIRPMHDRHGSHGEDMVAAGFLRDIVFFAARLGADPAELCRRAAITSALLADPDAMVPGRHAGSLWTAAVELTGDPDLGLRLGSAAHLASLGLVAPVLLHCHSLRQALHKLGDYSRLLLDSVVLEVLDVDAATTAIRLTLLPGDSYVARAPRQPIECSFAALLTIASQLAGAPLPVREVRLCHPAPPHTRTHATTFRAPVRFAAPENALLLPHGTLELPILLADPTMLGAHEAKARESMARRGADETAAGRTRRAIALLLRGSLPSIDDIAEQLHTSSRSLQRALTDEGRSFRELVDEVRHELAVLHLGDPQTSIAQVALLLGFSEPSAFHRAFKRWTGATPRQPRTTG